jgi:hypothetical protein
MEGCAVTLASSLPPTGAGLQMSLSVTATVQNGITVSVRRGSYFLFFSITLSNVVKYYVLMYENGKMRHFEIIPAMGGRKGKAE